MFLLEFIGTKSLTAALWMTASKLFFEMSLKSWD